MGSLDEDARRRSDHKLDHNLAPADELPAQWQRAERCRSPTGGN